MARPSFPFQPAFLHGLPDPNRQAEFYRGVPGRRLLAFLIDSIIIGVLTVIILPFTAFLGLFFLPVLISVISFIYRWLTLVSGSATWGMRLCGIELRDHRGERLGGLQSTAHIGLYLLCLGTVLPTIASLFCMMMTDRHQTLPDLFLGIAAIRTPG